MKYVQNVNYYIYGGLFNEVLFMDLENILLHKSEKVYFV